MTFLLPRAHPKPFVMRNIYQAGIPCLIGAIIFGCLQKAKEPKITPEQQNSISLRDSVFVSPYGGYGYDIIMDGSVKIHQPHIPVIAGNIGFSSVEDARKTAQVVILKMRQNQFPPRLQQEDLKDLGILP